MCDVCVDTIVSFGSCGLLIFVWNWEYLHTMAVQHRSHNTITDGWKYKAEKV